MWIGSFPYRFGKWGRRSWKKCIFHGPFQAIPKPFKLIRKSSTMTLFWEVHYERFYSLNSLLERKGDSRWSRKHWNTGKNSWVWHPYFLISYTPRITKMHIWKYSIHVLARNSIFQIYVLKIYHNLQENEVFCRFKWKMVQKISHVVKKK